MVRCINMQGISQREICLTPIQRLVRAEGVRSQRGLLQPREELVSICGAFNSSDRWAGAVVVPELDIEGVCRTERD